MSNSVYTEIILAGLLSQECSVTGNHGTTVFAFIKLLTLHSVLAYKNSNNKKTTHKIRSLAFWWSGGTWMYQSGCVSAPNVCASNAKHWFVIHSGAASYKYPLHLRAPSQRSGFPWGTAWLLKAAGALAGPMPCLAIWQGAQAPMPPARAG